MKKKIVNKTNKYNQPKEHKPLRVDIGCGKNKRNDGYWIGIDIIPFEGVDKVMNAGKDKWPFKDGSVDEIHASHFVEHLEPEERIHFVNELFRVLKQPVYNDGKLVSGFATIIVPHWASQRAYGDMTHCFSDDTEILTSNGWKKILDVRNGENVLTLNHDDKSVMYSPVIGTIKHKYNGEMLHFKNERMDILCTPNHDLLWMNKDGRYNDIYKDRADTFLKLSKTNHHPRRGVATIDNWEGNEYPNGLYGFDAELMFKFMGWYVSEGCVDRHKGHRIDICQSKEANPKKYIEICDLLTQMGISFYERKNKLSFSNIILYHLLEPLGTSNSKFIPKEFKNGTKELMIKLLECAIKGDGRKNSTAFEYCTTSKRLADDINEVALKCGYRSNISIEKRIGTPISINPKYEAKSDMYIVGISLPLYSWYSYPTKVKYGGDNIVCVTALHNNNIMVRRNGKTIWAGNCWPPVSEFWFYYLDKDWRAINAPHNQDYKCHINVTWGYSLHPELNSRNQEYQNEAIKWNKEACSDIIAQFTKKV